MRFNTDPRHNNALFHRAFLFLLCLSTAITLHAGSDAEVYVSSPDIQSLAESAQMIVASNTTLRVENLHIQVYRGYPDMTQVEAVNRHFQSGEALPSYAVDSFLGFVFSKPAIEKKVVSIHALYVLNKNGEPANEVWIKLKSNAALLKNFSKPNDKNPSATQVNVQQIQQAVFDQLKIIAPDFVASAVVIKQGPVWLDTPIERSVNNGKTTLALPIVETPLDVPERFAGHFYIKLLTNFDTAN
jgi:hypothetical protein